MIDVYDKNGNKVTLTDSNDLSHKTDFTRISNNDESIGKVWPSQRFWDLQDD